MKKWISYYLILIKKWFSSRVLESASYKVQKTKMEGNQAVITVEVTLIDLRSYYQRNMK